MLGLYKWLRRWNLDFVLLVSVGASVGILLDNYLGQMNKSPWGSLAGWLPVLLVTFGGLLRLVLLKPEV